MANMNRSAESDLWTARICVMILLPGITWILGMLPLWLTQLLKWDKKTVAGLQGVRAQFIFSKLLCFAGGVLLATVFMHLLPDLVELCEEQVTLGNLPDLGAILPWPYFFMMCGFFFVYLIEECAHAFVHWQSKAKHPRPPQPHAPTPCIEELQQNVTGNVTGIVIEEEKPPLEEENHKGHSHGGGHGHSHAPVGGPDDSLLANVRNILTVMALSFHCVFEGIAVGMEETSAEVWYLFGAIATHKFVISFCVGVELLVSSTRKLFIYIYIFIFGFVSALGIAIGLALSSSGEDGVDKNAATVTMQGMAAGTILYVTFFEILQREKNNKDNGFLQLASILLGFGAMVGLMGLAPDPE